MTAHRARFVLTGALLSLAVPAGLPFVRALARDGRFAWAAMAADLREGWAGYAWVALSAMLVTAVTAGVLGRRNDRARQLSITDPLTGLFNRRHFASQLDSAMVRDRKDGASTCVMCVDLDRLKALNDQYGHERGDAALVQVASALSRRLRARDIVARLGGDEFAVLLPDTRGDVAIRIGERVLAELEAHARELPERVSVSIGIAELESGVSANELLVAADRALYWVKSTGGGRVALAPRAVIGLGRARGGAA